MHSEKATVHPVWIRPRQKERGENEENQQSWKPKSGERNPLVARALWFQYDMNSIGSCFLNICLPADLEGCGTFKLEELARGQRSATQGKAVGGHTQPLGPDTLYTSSVQWMNSLSPQTKLSRH